MATDGFAAGMVVDATRVVFEIRVYGEGDLHGASCHDRLLDVCHPTCGHSLSGERILVFLVIVVRGFGIRVTFAELRWSALVRTSRLALGGVWVGTLWAM